MLELVGASVTMGEQAVFYSVFLIPQDKLAALCHCPFH